jgi:hypothetical protein
MEKGHPLKWKKKWKKDTHLRTLEKGHWKKDGKRTPTLVMRTLVMRTLVMRTLVTREKGHQTWKKRKGSLGHPLWLPTLVAWWLRGTPTLVAVATNTRRAITLLILGTGGIKSRGHPVSCFFSFSFSFPCYSSFKASFSTRACVGIATPVALATARRTRAKGSVVLADGGWSKHCAKIPAACRMKARSAGSGALGWENVPPAEALMRPDLTAVGVRGLALTDLSEGRDGSGAPCSNCFGACFDA